MFERIRNIFRYTGVPPSKHALPATHAPESVPATTHEVEATPSDSHPAAPSQHALDAAELSSAQWKAGLLESLQAWEHQINGLCANVEAIQKSGHVPGLMMISEYFDLPVKPDAVASPQLTAELRKRLESLFDVAQHRKLIEQKTATRWASYPRHVEIYVGEFIHARVCYLQGAQKLLDSLPEHMELVSQDIAALRAAESDHNPHAGGARLGSWRTFLKNYAFEKLPGLTPLNFFPAPIARHIRDQFKGEIETASMRYLWALLSLVRSMDQGASQSTSQIGIEFERRLIEEISDHFPGARIETTPVTGDQGADVITIIQGVKIAIQAKKYTGVVGNAAVQEAYSAMGFYDADFGMVVTTSRFTPAAHTLASKLGVELATADDYLRRIRQLLA